MDFCPSGEMMSHAHAPDLIIKRCKAGQAHRRRSVQRTNVRKMAFSKACDPMQLPSNPTIQCVPMNHE
jgi:hypothetical protein